MAQTKVKEGLIDAVLGGGLTLISTPKTAGFTAVAGESYLVDTSSSAITVALPGSPSVGDEIGILDYSSNAATNNITIDPGTLNLRGATDDLVISVNNESIRLIYSGATKGWLLKSGAAAAAPPPALTVNYLVVAGGGSAGGNEGGGGGAGGLRTSYGTLSGGLVAADNALALAVSTNYTVTVGAGGASTVPPPYYQGADGNNSVFNIITSTGGGGGAAGNNGQTPPMTVGRPGGSGGGGSRDGVNAAPGGARTASPIQGFDGGTSGLNEGDSTGGGGGAGAVGQSATGAGGFDGGIGITNAITVAAGTGPYYAGGGGGGAYNSAPNVGSGGNGGGGDGLRTGVPGSSNNGTPNTGGGAGGGGGSGNDNQRGGGSGGSGVIILRYPDAYTIAETTSSQLQSSTDETISGTKITTFTAGNGTIEFTT